MAITKLSSGVVRTMTFAVHVVQYTIALISSFVISRYDPFQNSPFWHTSIENEYIKSEAEGIFRALNYIFSGKPFDDPDFDFDGIRASFDRALYWAIPRFGRIFKHGGVLKKLPTFYVLGYSSGSPGPFLELMAIILHPSSLLFLLACAVCPIVAIPAYDRWKSRGTFSYIMAIFFIIICGFRWIFFCLNFPKDEFIMQETISLVQEIPLLFVVSMIIVAVIGNLVVGLGRLLGSTTGEPKCADIFTTDNLGVEVSFSQTNTEKEAV